MRGGRRGAILSVVWVLLLAGTILAHRAGLLPGWVYEGRFRDEVKRRTGVDLADRSAPKPIVEVSGIQGSGGRHPTLTLDVRNASDTTVRFLEMWARFHVATEPAGTSEAVRVAGGERGPLRAGETRRVTLRVAAPQGLGITTRGPLLTADLYWTFSIVAPHRRHRLTPRMYAIPVR